MDFLNHLPDLQKELTELLQQSDSLAFYCRKTNKTINRDDLVACLFEVLREKPVVYQSYFEVLFDYYNYTYSPANIKRLADTLISFYEGIWDLLQKNRADASGLGWYFGEMFAEQPSIFNKEGTSKHFFTDVNKKTTQQNCPQEQAGFHPFATEFKMIYDIRQWSQHNQGDVLHYKDNKEIKLDNRQIHAELTAYCLRAYAGIVLYYNNSLKKAIDQRTEPSFTNHLLKLQQEFETFAAQYLLHGKEDNYIEQSLEVEGGQNQPKSMDKIIETCKQVMLRGEAGYGKTTALRKFAADAAAKTIGDPKQPIPVFVELPLLQAQDLKSYLANQLNITTEQLEKLLQRNRLLLILDALNEVTQHISELKEQLNALANDHSGLKMIVSARSNDKYTLGKIKKYLRFKSISQQQIDTFLQKNCKPDYYSQIKQLPDPQKSTFYNMFKSAFLLKIYVEAAETAAKPIITENELLTTYMEQLFKREISEKSDTQFADQKAMFTYFLAYIAYNSGNEPFSDTQVVQWISECCKENNYPNNPQYADFVLLKATELDILLQQNAAYHFTSEHYHSYFASQL